MANRYWRGGAGTWNAANTTNWSATSGGAGGASVPTSADDVFFDANSGTGVVTLSGTVDMKARNIDCTGFTGTWTHTNGVYLNCYGNLTLASGMTYTPTSGARINMLSAAMGNTFNLANKTGLLYFNGTGGWTLAAAPSPGPHIFMHNTGTLSFGGFNVAFSTNGSMTSSGTGVRTLDISGSTLTLNAQWNTSDTTNLTFIFIGSTIVASFNFLGGGLTFNNVTMNANATITISGANTWNNWTTSGGGSGTVVNFADDQNITGTFSVSGLNAAARALYQSSVTGVQRTITAAVVATPANVDFKDIIGAGAGSWDFSAVTTVGDWGNNSNITFCPAMNLYWVPSGGTSTGTNNVATRWANASGGTAGSGRIPLCHDPLFCDVNSIDAASRTITNALPRIKSWNWTGVTNTPAFNRGTGQVGINGDMIMSSAVTHSGSSTLTFIGRGSHVLTQGSSAFNPPIILDAVTGTLTLGGDLSTTAAVTVTSGTFDMTGYTYTAGAITVGNGNLLLGTVTQGSFSMYAGGAGNTTFNGVTALGSFTIGLLGTGVVTVNENVTVSGVTSLSNGARMVFAPGKSFTSTNYSFSASPGGNSGPGSYGLVF